jgi:DNA-binding NarL/FixJ family response regulator
LGYRVLAGAGNSAPELVRQAGAEVDVVLLDWTLPRRHGEDTLALLRQANADAPVVLCAAYPTGPAIRAVEQHGAAGFVAKPFQPHELARTVRAAIDRSRACETQHDGQPCA